MNYNVNEIKEMLNFFNPEHFTDEDVDIFIEEFSNQNCHPEFTWEAGCTKCVIIPDNRDYVIKIPFDGSYDYYDDENGNFVYFYNGGGEEGWDYCELENEYWIDKIQDSEFSQFFLFTQMINVNNWPIYVQEKVVTVQEEFNRTHYSSINSLYKVRESGTSSRVDLPDDWLAVCLENLNNDIDKLNEFIDFLKDNFSDLHIANIGYCGNQAVILDYAGFDD